MRIAQIAHTCCSQILCTIKTRNAIFDRTFLVIEHPLKSPYFGKLQKPIKKPNGRKEWSIEHYCLGCEENSISTNLLALKFAECSSDNKCAHLMSSLEQNWVNSRESNLSDANAEAAVFPVRRDNAGFEINCSPCSPNN